MTAKRPFSFVCVAAFEDFFVKMVVFLFIISKNDAIIFLLNIFVVNTAQKKQKKFVIRFSCCFVSKKPCNFGISKHIKYKMFVKFVRFRNKMYYIFKFLPTFLFCIYWNFKIRAYLRKNKLVKYCSFVNIKKSTKTIFSFY